MLRVEVLGFWEWNILQLSPNSTPWRLRRLDTRTFGARPGPQTKVLDPPVVAVTELYELHVIIRNRLYVM